MRKLTEEEIQKGLDEAYKNAESNAYFGNGFKAGIEFALNQGQTLLIHSVVGQSEQLCKHKRVIKSRLRMVDGKSRYCKDCQEWII